VRDKSDDKQFFWLLASWFAFYLFGFIDATLYAFNKQFDLMFLFGMLFSVVLFFVAIKNLCLIVKR